jgi:hypothetical protein
MDSLRRSFRIGRFAPWIGILAVASCTSYREPERNIWEERFRREEALESQLGSRVELQGVARNWKLGAAVDELWIDGLQSWPPDCLGKKILVSGTLIRRDDYPVFRRLSEESPKAGIPVPEGVDLERARRRYLITEARWSKLTE